MKFPRRVKAADIRSGLGMYLSFSAAAFMVGLSIWAWGIALAIGAVVLALYYFPLQTVVLAALVLLLRIPALGVAALLLLAGWWLWERFRPAGFLQPGQPGYEADLVRHAERKLRRERGKRLQELREQGFEGYAPPEK